MKKYEVDVTTALISTSTTETATVTVTITIIRIGNFISEDAGNFINDEVRGSNATPSPFCDSAPSYPSSPCTSTPPASVSGNGSQITGAVGAETNGEASADAADDGIAGAAGNAAVASLELGKGNRGNHVHVAYAVRAMTDVQVIGSYTVLPTC